ncbi:hypothetical protein FJ981_28035 [Mesorhizobium sp. B1-1-4]|uniref:hypothetical protein n=1 Tax=Mesorhizobium sp. B1-1-4 TaxID=2589980 RepID=UPI0011275E0A|nr:hypothetical protein [Mesorhizobium sp. B1-1-4]TPN44448.1 hypothetical protein FJ981_28035 [Mesorhizobium sp. B1-1-4]
MRIRIEKAGIFGKDGEYAVGTELDVQEEPKVWGDRYTVISEGRKSKAAVTNPEGGGEVKTAGDVLALADGNFMAFKSAAAKLLGDKTPSKKDEIVAALEDLATTPE